MNTKKPKSSKSQIRSQSCRKKSISKSESSFQSNLSSQPSHQLYAKPPKTIDPKLNELTEKFEYLKELNRRLIHQTELKNKENQIKDDEIDKINTEINQIIVNNYNLQTAIDKEISIGTHYAREQKRIGDYTNNLLEKLRHYDEIVNEYKEKITKFQAGNKKLEIDFEKKIKKLTSENKKLEEKLVNDSKKLDLQVFLNGDIEFKLKDMNREVESYRQDLCDKKIGFINKLKSMEIEYDRLTQNLFDMKYKLDENDVILMKTRRIRQKNKYKDDKMNEIFDSQLHNEDKKNDKLVEKIGSLNKTLRDMNNNSTIDFKDKKYDRILFLREKRLNGRNNKVFFDFSKKNKSLSTYKKSENTCSTVFRTQKNNITTSIKVSENTNY